MGQTFDMHNRLEAVDPMVDTLKACVEGILPDMDLFRFDICVTEALTNIVRHAQTTEAEAPIVIVVETTAQGVSVSIFDPVGAAPFDPRLHAKALDDVELMAESGRGLGLIVQTADNIDYGDQSGRNRLRLDFRPSTPPSPAAEQ